MTIEEAIIELRNEAQALENKPCTLSQLAEHKYKAKIRRNLAERLERALKETQAPETIWEQLSDR